MDTLKTKGYRYIKDVLSPDLVQYLTSWNLKNFQNKGDPQAPLSFSVHSMHSPIYAHLLHHLHPRMEKETDLKLKPIYCYTRVYLGGSELKRHIDRPACEISASITLKYFYQDKHYKWPLCMGDIPIVIKSGDGVIYKGCEIEHWRPFFTQPKECWHHQLFIHYVDLNGPYSDLEEENEKS